MEEKTPVGIILDADKQTIRFIKEGESAPEVYLYIELIPEDGPRYEYYFEDISSGTPEPLVLRMGAEVVTPFGKTYEETRDEFLDEHEYEGDVHPYKRVLQLSKKQIIEITEVGDVEAVKEALGIVD